MPHVNFDSYYDPPEDNSTDYYEQVGDKHSKGFHAWMEERDGWDEDRYLNWVDMFMVMDLNPALAAALVEEAYINDGTWEGYELSKNVMVTMTPNAFLAALNFVVHLKDQTPEKSLLKSLKWKREDY